MKDYEIDYKKLYEEEHKKYEGALERARGHHSVALHYNNADEIQELEHIFPELKEKESEDEKVRKELVEFIKHGNCVFDCLEQKNRFWAWLEKQGELSKYNPHKETVESISTMVDKYSRADSDLQDFYDNVKVKCKDAIEYYNTFIEKQDEQKPADKVEPKFKVGDWVIDKQDIVHQIANVVENVTNHTYGYDTVDGGYFNDNTEGVRFWTIQDAKDGDVLTTDTWTFIFKKYQDKSVYYHCATSAFNNFSISDTGEFDSNCVHPATKEFKTFHRQAMYNLPNINNMINWLDKKMFDHRGLIPKGLALEAKEGMYNLN